MPFRSTTVLLYAGLLATLLLSLCLAPQTEAKAVKRTPSSHGYYFVPPPPAYMPSILPELKSVEEADAPKPTDPAKKYIYTREGYEDPPPVRPNKHVTYWNPSDNKL